MKELKTVEVNQKVVSKKRRKEIQKVEINNKR